MYTCTIYSNSLNSLTQSARAFKLIKIYQKPVKVNKRVHKMYEFYFEFFWIYVKQCIIYVSISITSQLQYCNKRTKLLIMYDGRLSWTLGADFPWNFQHHESTTNTSRIHDFIFSCCHHGQRKWLVSFFIIIIILSVSISLYCFL